jgi:hypothetical protein
LLIATLSATTELGQERLHSWQCSTLCAPACQRCGHAFARGCYEERYESYSGKRVVACLLTARTQRLHKLLPRLSRAPHDLPKCVLDFCLARCQCCPRDEPLYDETRMTRLAAPPGCTFGTSIGPRQGVERQRWYALSANQERVPSMLIPSSGFLDVLPPPFSLHRCVKVPLSSDNELKKHHSHGRTKCETVPHMQGTRCDLQGTAVIERMKQRNVQWAADRYSARTVHCDLNPCASSVQSDLGTTT